jgi:c-di-GMP-binding flagellar brake protein YcgR
MKDIYNEFKDIKAFEVVFLDEEGNHKKIFCDFKKSIDNEFLLVSANNESNKNFAEADTELKLHIYTENGIYSASSKILEAVKGNKNTEYTIIYPDNGKLSQRREFFRADWSVLFKMDIITNKKKDEKISINSKTKNICGKGISFIYDSEFPKYDEINVELILDEKNIKTNASLVYSKKISSGTCPKFIHAFNFTNISTRDIDFIVKKCFLYQLELRKK